MDQDADKNASAIIYGSVMAERISSGSPQLFLFTDTNLLEKKYKGIKGGECLDRTSGTRRRCDREHLCVY